TTGAPTAVPVDREVFVQPGVGTVPVDVRTTPLAAAVPINSSGGSLTSGALTVSVVPGSVSSSTNFHLTTLSQQGLPGFLPLGWSPVTAFDLRSDSSSSATFNASFTQLPGSLTLYLVSYDYSQHVWTMITPGIGAPNGSLTIPLPSTAVYALVVPDIGNT